MREKKINILTLLLLTVSLSASAQKTTPNISEWTENTSFGKNGANLTADGYSLWDGHSRQKYSFNSEGNIEICNAAQLARYAYDMYQASSNVRNDRTILMWAANWKAKEKE